MTATDGHTAWQKFICQACGHIYDEAMGDGTLPAGTRLDDIDEGWGCPVCGASKDDFELCKQTTHAKGDHTSKAGIVIIGAGLAGWSVVDALRAIDKDIAITLITADDADRYHKPMLSVAISGQKTPDDLIRSTGRDAAHAANIRLLADTWVWHIDAVAKQVHTTHGDIPYDDLVLAIGANPIYPPSIDHAMAWHINHLQPFAKLQARLNDSKKHLAIIGAGMVGTEFAEDLIRAGHKVSLIDVSAHPLSALLPKVASDRILAAITALGVDFIGNALVQGVERTADGYSIQIQDGTSKQMHTLMVDDIVMATGLMVDEHLPDSAGIDFDRRTGITVHPTTLQTSAPHIYAIGDCISIEGVPCRYVAPHRAQAAAIAGHILQGVGNYEHKAPMIRLKNKCITVTANGLPHAEGDWRIDKDDAEELSLSMYQDGQVIAKALLKTPPKQAT